MVWGANDPSFVAPGGSFRQDLPKAEVHLLGAGHFALEEKLGEIASLILEFGQARKMNFYGRDRSSIG